MKSTRRPSYLDFDAAEYSWKAGVDYRKHPEKYRVGRGEQGVLICEPYKSELVAHWRFKTPAEAQKSSSKILQMFERFLKDNDFVGADMARKFLQMGFTRARRYANYKSGIKYHKANNFALNKKGSGDPEKAESASIFFQAWKQAEANENYADMKRAWKNQLG